MAKQAEKILNLTDKTCRMGKISNNLENHGGEWVTAFTIPITGLMLTKDELNDFLRDKYAHSCWFDTKRGMVQPMAWWGGESFAISGSYEAEELKLELSGARMAEFLAEEPDNPEDEDDVGTPACRINRIELTPLAGGLTEMRFSVYLHPGVGKTNLLLQEHQHREVKLTLIEARATAEDSRQAQLPLAAGAEQATAP